eukprot:m.106519 g.106519  ORF g.106519 m.106519 type:complete len:204 (+) comp16904_c0_seq1:347-958(+)
MSPDIVAPATDELLDVELDVALEPPQPVTERYYKEMRFACDLKGVHQQDQYVLQHSNSLMVIGLAKLHPLRQPGAPVPVSIRFCEKITSQKPSGKKKLGAAWLNELSPVCYITCTDGAEYTVFSGIRGSLYELNQRIVADPTLLINHPETAGHVAIVSPKLKEKYSVTSALMTRTQYRQRCADAANAPAAAAATADDCVMDRC